eukprot:5732615-Pyramimonas_sp.AAC.1
MFVPLICSSNLARPGPAGGRPAAAALALHAGGTPAAALGCRGQAAPALRAGGPPPAAAACPAPSASCASSWKGGRA